MPTVVPPRVCIVSTSLNTDSRSCLLARRALEVFDQNHPDIAHELIDLREIGPLPVAGSPESYQPHARLDEVKETLAAATHILIALPIYNFSGSASTKNLIELMGEPHLGGKTVGFLCSAGGPRAYMGVLSLANALMLDFRCWIVPRFVYATGADFAAGVLTSEEIGNRIEQTIADMLGHGPTVP